MSDGRIHLLKCRQPFLRDIMTGLKLFEVRRNDRNFNVGDILELREWDGENYGLCHIEARISYLLDGGQFGIEPGFVVLGLRPHYDTASPLEIATLTRERDQAREEVETQKVRLLFNKKAVAALLKGRAGYDDLVKELCAEIDGLKRRLSEMGDGQEWVCDCPQWTERCEADAGGAGLIRYDLERCEPCCKEYCDAEMRESEDGDYVDADDALALQSENESLHGECLLKDRVIGTKDERIAELERMLELYTESVARLANQRNEAQSELATLQPLADLGLAYMERDEALDNFGFESDEYEKCEASLDKIVEQLREDRAAQPKQDEEDAK